MPARGLGDRVDLRRTCNPGRAFLRVPRVSAKTSRPETRQREPGRFSELDASAPAVARQGNEPTLAPFALEDHPVTDARRRRSPDHLGLHLRGRLRLVLGRGLGYLTRLFHIRS